MSRILIFLMLMIAGYYAGGKEAGNSLTSTVSGRSEIGEVKLLGKGSLDGAFARIPLKRAGNLFLVEAVIDSVRGNFILDLGAPYLVLNAIYFRDYKVDFTASSQGMVSGAGPVKWTKVDRLDATGLRWTNLVADITDLGAIENQRNVKVLGLLGISLFDDFILELDIANLQLLVHRTGSTVNTDGTPLIELPFRLRNDVATVKAVINGVELNFSLDTAAEANVLDNDLPAAVYGEMRILSSSLLRDANSGATEVLSVIIPGTVIAGRKVRNMQTLIVNLNTMRTAYERNIQGMFGYPFFSQGRTVIDFETNTLTIYTNVKIPEDE